MAWASMLLGKYPTKVAHVDVRERRSLGARGTARPSRGLRAYKRGVTRAARRAAKAEIVAALADC